MTNAKFGGFGRLFNSVNDLSFDKGVVILVASMYYDQVDDLIHNNAEMSNFFGNVGNKYLVKHVYNKMTDGKFKCTS